MSQWTEAQAAPEAAEVIGERFLRRQQVEEITGLSRSSIYRLIEGGQFPRPVRVGPNAVRWPSSVIADWMRSRPLAGN